MNKSRLLYGVFFLSFSLLVGMPVSEEYDLSERVPSPPPVERPEKNIDTVSAEETERVQNQS